MQTLRERTPGSGLAIKYIVFEICAASDLPTKPTVFASTPATGLPFFLPVIAEFIPEPAFHFD